MNDAADRRVPVQEETAGADAFGAQLETWRLRMEGALAARLPEPSAVPSRLHEAMRYSVLGGGKRIRPALVFATARALGPRRGRGRGGGLRHRTGACLLAGAR